MGRWRRGVRRILVGSQGRTWEIMIGDMDITGTTVLLCLLGLDIFEQAGEQNDFLMGCTWVGTG